MYNELKKLIKLAGDMQDIPGRSSDFPPGKYKNWGELPHTAQSRGDTAMPRMGHPSGALGIEEPVWPRRTTPEQIRATQKAHEEYSDIHSNPYRWFEDNQYPIDPVTNAVQWTGRAAVAVPAVAALAKASPLAAAWLGISGAGRATSNMIIEPEQRTARGVAKALTEGVADAVPSAAAIAALGPIIRGGAAVMPSRVTAPLLRTINRVPPPVRKVTQYTAPVAAYTALKPRVPTTTQTEDKLKRERLFEENAALSPGRHMGYYLHEMNNIELEASQLLERMQHEPSNSPAFQYYKNQGDKLLERYRIAEEEYNNLSTTSPQ